MNKIELLAPAGSMESLVAAVQEGADAVYLGGSEFSARAFANNFDDEKMKWAIDYCHMYNVKAYITMNTLIKERELQSAFNYAAKLYSFGADALIVQDTGLAFLLNKYIPDFELHGSTQMTIHNGEAVEFFKNRGFRRIVLSRELSLGEIKNISNSFKVETEIFVHGALCICYSGQCLMSSIIGGRSGNRGRCAQPCRMEYTLINKNNNEIKKAYMLSPKDMNLLENLKEIIESGTTSLKIEGRMKRPEYVSGVIKVYREAIDACYNGSKINIEESNKMLLKLFNREGFSKAYMFGNSGKDMMAYSFPKNTGIIVGNVEKGKNVRLIEPLFKGDGIRVGKGDEGFIVTKIFKTKEEVDEAAAGEIVSIKPSNFSEGDILYKTSDIKLNNELKRSYEKVNNKKIDITLKVKFRPDNRLMIQFEYMDKKYQIEGEIIQNALNKPTTMEKLQENLSKSGDTPFRFWPIDFEEYKEGFVPVASINQLRRTAVEEIEKSIIGNKLKMVDYDIVHEENIKANIIDSIIYVSTEDQYKAAKELKFENICVDVFNKNSLIEVDYLKVPNIIREEFESVEQLIESNINSIKGIVTANAGIIKKFRNRTKIIGDYKLNVFNSFATKMYSDAVEGSCLSIELNKSEIFDIMSQKDNNYQVFLYGKPELMVTEYCPVGSIFGGKSSQCKCAGNCATGKYVLRDRKGEEFSLIQDKFCRSHIYNRTAINLIPHMKELMNMGVKSFRLDFIDESYEETTLVLKAYKEKKWTEEYSNYTRGHYKRGVD